MKSFCILFSCLLFGGCSKGAIGTLPEAPNAGNRAVDRGTLGTTKVLKFFYDFKGNSDGVLPSSGLIDVNGALYGTTEGGGSSGRGTIFRLTPGSETVVHSFAGGPSDGAQPWSDLIDVNGTLYGTTYQGGNTGSQCTFIGCGTVFKITPAGAETVLYEFTRGADGGGPVAGLTNVNGTLYGTTYYGGANDYGTVFKIAASGKESVLHSFGGASDGTSPEAGLTYFRGALYGTTRAGGSKGFGAVFKVTLAGAETVVHSFTSGADGAAPVANLVELDGTLYGTTASGGNGTKCGSSGCGTIYKVTPSGTESVLYQFTGGIDGAGPLAALIDIGGTLYGTATGGGTGTGCGSPGYCGVVFKITTAGAETVLYNFMGTFDGASPQLGRLIDVNGRLYGTTAGFTNNTYGTAFGIAI